MDVTLHQGRLEAKGNRTLAEGWLGVEGGASHRQMSPMAAYLGRFQVPVGMTCGILAYPCDPTKPEVPPAEQASVVPQS